ncbi:hypothetical protein SKAU_G00058760 [Synaphobranchus kaupii]|uniref:Uncharacterized protein n=1 Tax=Synaphobranchus kaupii TaxID=118154 RepID=A0A9Q1G4Y1_SYNKA|nr:hypothetical protein SKAU_G00058760 [Synaphobranchus kaupii]
MDSLSSDREGAEAEDNLATDANSRLNPAQGDRGNPTSERTPPAYAHRIFLSHSAGGQRHGFLLVGRVSLGVPHHLLERSAPRFTPTHVSQCPLGSSRLDSEDIVPIDELTISF